MKKIFFGFAFLCLMACEQAPKSYGANKSWHGSMRGLANSLSAVAPQLIVSPYRLTQDDRKKINRVIDDLDDYSKHLDSQKMVIPSQDPSTKYIAQDFQKEIAQMQSLRAAKDFGQKQSRLRHLTRYCVACHSKTPAASAQFANPMGEAIENFNDFEKGEFYMAMRQYEKAMVHLEKGLTDADWAKAHKSIWNKGAMQLLAVTVRVRDDASLTLEMISRLFDTQAYPKDLQTVARVWRQDAKAWQKQSQGKASLRRVSSLLKQAQAREKKVQHSGLILNLRAQKLLNQYLQTGGLSAKSEQAVLYYSGVLNQRLERLQFSSFPKAYFQACVDLNPESKVGSLCQRKLATL
jgi:tetratricopeptide (TPR) repeat protein